MADDLGKGHAYVTAAGADVDAAPTLAQPEAVESGGQRPPVDVVAKSYWGVLEKPAENSQNVRVFFQG
jgi:hypothetical protein